MLVIDGASAHCNPTIPYRVDFCYSHHMLVSSSHYERVVVVVVFSQFAEAEQLYRRLVDDTNACQYQVHTAQVSTLSVTFVYICTYICTCVSTYIHTYVPMNRVYT